MIVWWLIILLFITKANSVCVKNKIKLWSPTKCEAGRTFFAKLRKTENYSDQRIKQPYLYPWLSEIQIGSSGTFRFCSGALINDRYVLTAQSCIFPPVQPFQVIANIGFFNGYNQDVSEMLQPRILKINAKNFILHPSYNPNDPQTSGNNLGLIQLEEPVKYSKTIYPIQLPFPGDKFMNYGNKPAENVEWSFNLNNKDLKENFVKILNSDQCANFNNYKKIVTPDVICALDVGNDTKQCGEEKGGLLTITKTRRLYNITTLIGISAWDPPGVKPCGDLALPRVYVFIANKLSWIKANTHNALYCRY